MAELTDVRFWYVRRGIGHIVTSSSGGWHYEACRVWSSGDPQAERPRRICRRCRAALRSMTVSAPASAPAPGSRDDD